jgi:hypothetical protein
MDDIIDIGYLKDARSGLQYIMNEKGATMWEQKTPTEFVIMKYGYKGRATHYIVPLKNIEAAESDLKYGMPPMRWVADDIRAVEEKVPKPRAHKAMRGRPRRRK